MGGFVRYLPFRYLEDALCKNVPQTQERHEKVSSIKLGRFCFFIPHPGHTGSPWDLLTDWCLDLVCPVLFRVIHDKVRKKDGP